MAVELAGYRTGTEDVDPVVTMSQFSRSLSKLSKDRMFRNVEELSTIGGAQFYTGDRWVDVDFINPRLFKGRRTGDEFVSYIRRYRSRKTRWGHVAGPEVTWYMRLCVPDWLIYVQKIIRDVRAGVPEDVLEKSLGIARALGVHGEIAARVRKVRQVLSTTRWGP